MAAPTYPYALGQGALVTKLFSERTLQRDGAFLLPFLKPGFRILDVGCGPGSITCDFAQFVGEHGHVTGVDLSPVAIENAQKAAQSRGLANMKFQTADITAGLPFKDGEFDLVFCHMVLTHLVDPVQALKEMKRLAKPGTGFVAAREMLEIKFYPPRPLLEELFEWSARARQKISNTTHVHNGQYLYDFANDAGFEPSRVIGTVSGTSLKSREEKALYLHARGVFFADNTPMKAALGELGLTEEKTEQMFDDLNAWIDSPGVWSYPPSSELVYMVP